MTTEKQIKLAESLVSATKSGKITWERLATDKAFVSKFDGLTFYLVYVVSQVSFSDKTHKTYEFNLSVLDSSNDLGTSFLNQKEQLDSRINVTETSKNNLGGPVIYHPKPELNPEAGKALLSLVEEIEKRVGNRLNDRELDSLIESLAS